MKRLDLPLADGPWSWRTFADERAAKEFSRRLSPDQPQPFELTEPHDAPDGNVLRPGTWVVLYRPIIF